jgi:hypothetical protein
VVKLALIRDTFLVDAVLIDPAGRLYAVSGDEAPQDVGLDLAALDPDQSLMNACRLELSVGPALSEPAPASPDHLSLRLYDESGYGEHDLAWIRAEEPLAFTYFGWPRRPALVRVGENGNLARLEEAGWYSAQTEGYGTLVLGESDYLNDQLRNWMSGHPLWQAATPGRRQRLSLLAV